MIAAGEGGGAVVAASCREGGMVGGGFSMVVGTVKPVVTKKNESEVLSVEGVFVHNPRGFVYMYDVFKL